jgi:hypothetical protein
MKWLLRSFLLIAIAGISCSKTTNTTVAPVGYSLAPTITRFSPDTVWTFRTDTIYGTNFSYDYYNARVFIDTLQLSLAGSPEDTVVTVTLPEGAQTGLIHVWSYEQSATSLKPLVVKYTFNPHAINDTVPNGGSFSIPGTGLNNSHGLLRLFVGGIPFPIDSVFPNRIVSHTTHNSLSGTFTLSDSDGIYNNIGTLTVTYPSAWTTLSQIYNYITVTESHTRTGYTNGPVNTIDSTWTTTAYYAGQHDTNVAGINFARTPTGLQYSAGPVQIVWDTVNQTAAVTFVKYSYAPTTQTHSLDTEWYAGYSSSSLPAPLPVNDDILFDLPYFGYQITEDSTDTQGLVNWQEQTTARLTSGEFEIILKH